MDFKVKFWITAILVSLFLGFVTFFVGPGIITAVISLAVSLLVYYAFRKDNIDFIKLGLLMFIGVFVVVIFTEIFIVYPLSVQLQQTNAVSGPTVAQLFSRPIEAAYSFIVSLIFFILPFIAKEKLPEKYFRIFIWIAISLIVLFILILPILRGLLTRSVQIG